MNHHLFRHLVENNTICVGVAVAVASETYDNNAATGITKGTFTVQSIYGHPLLQDTRLVVSDGVTTLDITKNEIKLIAGKLPSVLGEETGYVPFELPTGEPGPKLNSAGKLSRVRLNDSLDEFKASDFNPDNYVEEKVDPDEFRSTTHITYG